MSEEGGRKEEEERRGEERRGEEAEEEEEREVPQQKQKPHNTMWGMSLFRDAALPGFSGTGLSSAVNCSSVGVCPGRKRQTCQGRDSIVCQCIGFLSSQSNLRSSALESIGGL